MLFQHPNNFYAIKRMRLPTAILLVVLCATTLGFRSSDTGGDGAGGARVTVNVHPPTTPQVGDLWFDPVSVQLYIWYTDPTSSQWVPVINQPTGGGGGGAAAIVHVSATAPVSPTIGTLWFDTTDVQMYIFYNDGTSSQWVPVVHK